MPKSSPVKPLRGNWLLTQRGWITFCDSDGTPRENRIKGGRGYSDPTHAMALRLMRAQSRAQRSGRARAASC